MKFTNAATENQKAQNINQTTTDNPQTPDTDTDTVASRILAIRTRAGLSQQQFAERIMVTRAAVSKWENGSGIPSVDSCQMIAREFDVSIDYILMSSDVMSSPKRQSFTKIWQPQGKFGKKCSKLSYAIAIPSLCALLGVMHLACLNAPVAELANITSNLLFLVFLGMASWGYLDIRWRVQASLLSTVVGIFLLLALMNFGSANYRPTLALDTELVIMGYIAALVILAVLFLIGFIRFKIAQRATSKNALVSESADDPAA